MQETLPKGDGTINLNIRIGCFANPWSWGKETSIQPLCLLPRANYLNTIMPFSLPVSVAAARHKPLILAQRDKGYTTLLLPLGKLS